MDVKYINPFINAVIHTLSTMLGSAPIRLAPSLKRHNVAQGDVSAIIGFAGSDAHGSVALSFPQKTALHIFHSMMGETATKINRDVEDSVGELVNIVAGGAKTALENEELTIHISIPTVVVGKNHTIAHKGSTPVVLIPFLWDGFEFVMEVSMKLDPARSSAQRQSLSEAVEAV